MLIRNRFFLFVLFFIISCLEGSICFARSQLSSANILSLSKTENTSLDLSKLDRAGWTKFNDNFLVGSYNDEWVEVYSLKKHEPYSWIKVSSSLSTPVLVSEEDGNIYFYLALQDSSIVKVDFKTGSILWQTKLDSYVNRSMSVYKNSLICFSSSQKLYSLNISTGEQQWIYDSGISSDIILEGGASPVVKSIGVFVGYSSGDIHCVSLQGDLLWKFDFQDSSGSKFKDVVGTILVQDNMVVFSRADGYVICFDYSSQEKPLIWKDKLIGVSTSRSSLKDNDLFYVASFDKQLVLYSIKDGSNKKVNLISTVSYLYETQSYIFTLSNDGIVSAVKDGKLVWNYDLQTNLVSSPFIYASRIYVVSSYKNLYGFEFNF